MNGQVPVLDAHAQRGIGFDCLWLFIVLSVLYFILLGTRPLFTPDEGRYAEIAREMVMNQDYITPFLNGIKYFEKPILFYWLEAAAIKIGGLNLWSLRSINASLAILGCLATYLIVRYLYDRKTAILAALIQGTSLLYFVMGHMISLDMPLTFFLSVSLYSFIAAAQPSTSLRSRRLLMYVAAICAACAVLTKGLVGIVFPGMIIFLWMLRFTQWRLLATLSIPTSILIFLIVAMPWHLVVGYYNPEFYHFYFVEQHFLRYATKEVGHNQPAWFFIPSFMVGFFPWITFLPQTVFAIATDKSDRKQHQTTIFFALWAVAIFVFFSFSHSKLLHYILPIFPPAAILVAVYIGKALTTKKLLGMRIGMICTLVTGVGLLVCVNHFLSNGDIPYSIAARNYLFAATLLIIFGSLAAIIILTRHPVKAIATYILSLNLFLLCFLGSIPFIETRSILPLTNTLNTILQPQDRVITYNQYFQDLPFYLNRTVSILNWQNELRFGMDYQDTRDILIDDNEFWRLWMSTQHVFVIISKEEYQNFVVKHSTHNTYKMQETQNNLVMSNHPIPTQ